MSVISAWLRGYSRIDSSSGLPTTTTASGGRGKGASGGGRLLGSARRRQLFGITALCTLALLAAMYSRGLSLSLPESWSVLSPGGVPIYSRQCTALGDDVFTTRLGGSPGYAYLENVWYKNRTIYVHPASADSLPQGDYFVTGIGWETLDSVADIGPPAACMAGTTMFLNEGAGSQWNGLYHYYHFAAENLVGGLVAMATSRDAAPYVPDRLITPWVNAHDVWGMNEMVIEGIWDKDHMTAEDWHMLDEEIETGWIYFERMVLVDRWTAHRHSPEVENWFKMHAAIVNVPHDPHFWTGVRDKLLKHYGIRGRTPGEAPKIVYISRQSSDRKLPEETQAELMTAVDKLAHDVGATFEYLQLENLSPVEQVKAVADATVMFGIHGNGLTHLMWLPDGAAVLELFPPTTFARDYEMTAEVLGHDYTGILNDTEFLVSELDGKVKPDLHHEALHDGTPILLDVPFFINELKGALERVGSLNPE